MMNKKYISYLVIFIVLTIVAAQRCRTPNNTNGRCISLRECKPIYSLIERKQNSLTQSERHFINASQCLTGTGRSPYVCCGPNDPFLTGEIMPTTTINPINVEPSNGLGNVLPGSEECGNDIIAHLVLGGKEAALEEFSWMVLLEYQNSNGPRDFACGGSLINHRYVVTAAHCLVGKILQAKGRLVSVRLGEHNTETEEDCYVDGTIKECTLPAVDVRVEQIVAHPSYFQDDKNRANDIGLVRLAANVKYSDNISPICLPSVDLRSPTGTNLTVAGWGRTLTSKKSTTKQKLRIPIADFEECRQKFATRQAQLQDSQICAGGKYAEDTCDGDSGGPLMAQINGFWTLEGIVSFGYECGFAGWPAVYTRVASYRDWIVKNMKP